MGQALYRKYRSKRLNEIVGQEHITSTLSTALSQNRIAHAYLFTGPRGVGKTSIARILAHEINQLPYTDESVHIDIIEIDAASNRRIDEIRDLREKVHIAPTSARYKVYIIDEVHMLTKEAFNALLKTLEEPPAHVIFILATTEAHKLPITIVSRTQRFQFHSVDQQKVITHLRSIAKSEDIQVDDDALALIAAYGEGSFRDSIGLLDQAASTATAINRTTVESLIGLAPDILVTQLIAATATGPASLIINTLVQARQQGIAAPELAKQLADELRQRIGQGDAHTIRSYAQLLRTLIETVASSNQWLSLELALLEAFAAQQPIVPNTAAQSPQNITPATVPQAEPELAKPAAEIIAKPLDEQVPAVAAKPATTATMWEQVLEDVRENHNTLYGVLRMAQADVTAEKVRLTFKFPFHQKRVKEAKHLSALSDTITKVSGKTYEIECVIVETAQQTTAAATVDGGNPLAAVSAIFGDAELVEE